MKITPKEVRQELLSTNPDLFKLGGLRNEEGWVNIFYDLKELINFELFDLEMDGEQEYQLMYFSDKLGKMIVWEQMWDADFGDASLLVQWIVKTHNEIDAFENQLPNLAKPKSK
jgi:hypothetical protein